MSAAESARIIRTGEAALREARRDPAASAFWAWINRRAAR